MMGNFHGSQASGGRTKKKPLMYTQCGDNCSAEVSSRRMANLE